MQSVDLDVGVWGAGGHTARVPDQHRHKNKPDTWKVYGEVNRERWGLEKRKKHLKQTPSEVVHELVIPRGAAWVSVGARDKSRGDAGGLARRTHTLPWTPS